jgi:hypothetical protein
MNDIDVMSHIEELVAEEQRLLAAGSSGDGLTSEQHARLRAIKIELDRYWDLLRQRRAHAEFGLDADHDASLRDAGTVEHYEQ